MSQKSPKQQAEFDGQEKHIWHLKLKKLTELRFKEIEEESIEEDPSTRRGIDDKI